jgi:hypothetical protein
MDRNKAGIVDRYRNLTDCEREIPRQGATG